MKKAALDAVTDQGKTPLIWAALNGHRETCLWLIEHGCNLRIKDYTCKGVDFHLSALDWATKKVFY